MPSADTDDRRRRLLFRCWQRGTQELDLETPDFEDLQRGTVGRGRQEMMEVSVSASRELSPWWKRAALATMLFGFAVLILLTVKAPATAKSS